MLQSTVIALTPENNPKLAGLAGRKYTKGITEVPNKALPQSLVAELNVIYGALTGQPLPTDDSTVVVKANKETGGYERCYTPKLYINETADGLVIRWGSVSIPVTLEKGKLSVANQDVEFIFSKEDLGKGAETVLKVTYSNDDYPMGLILLVAIGFEDYSKAPNSDVLNQLVKRQPKDLLQVISKPSTGGSGLDAYSMGALNADGSEKFPVGSYTIIGYREVSIGERVSFLMVMADETGEGSCEIWANQTVSALLSGIPKPIITKEQPATLFIYSKKLTKQGKVSVQAALVPSSFTKDESGDALNLDF